jgi:hypothetical protein
MGDFRWSYLGNAVAFAALGVGMLGAALGILNRRTGYWKKIVEEKHLALAVYVGALTLALAWIIAAAVH